MKKVERKLRISQGRPQPRKLIRKAAVLVHQEGLTPTNAMKEIGYADTTAVHKPTTLTENPIYKEESGRIRAALIKKDEKVFDKVAGVMLAGLGARETKFFQHEGRVRDKRNLIAWGERRQYAELIANLFGEMRPTDQPGGGVVNIGQLVILIRQAEQERGLSS